MATSNKDKPCLNCSFCNIRRHVIPLHVDFVKYFLDPRIKSILNYYPMICWRINSFSSFLSVHWFKIYRLLFKYDLTKTYIKQRTNNRQTQINASTKGYWWLCIS